ncbi:right-handed parallel beta-helix repeat-containing protein [Anaerocolumna sp. MB42-C2]|uniref:right-handed parallel beta-helix repeat-containing protein n=1 Tax=Anaerocolumna sp. MB42-C2 TaxID=3070997 RepID=UPI0027DEDF21|nr:right-handed parallel beta-helix repeat-containing protein [Anaerocolumna sp. MB42-C2]WMJ88968.1 right-handed parallel beta-helix repeat-containing protein [Anaerocolumna sp. MB42-C2]
MKKNIYPAFLILLIPFIIFIYSQIYVNARAGKDRSVTAHEGDNASDLQRLLDYNKYNTYHLTVNIPAGNYELSKELRIYSNTTIIADYNARLFKKHQRGGILANDLTNDKGGYNTTENITIIGGIWDSYQIANMDKGTESFRFIHATNVTVKDATICNVPNRSHLVTFGGVKNGVVDNCTLYGYSGTTPKEAIQIDIVHNDTILPSMQSKILVYDDLPCDGITVTNCDIYNFPRAVGSHTSVKGVFHKNIIISDNNLHDLAEAAIKAFNYVNLEISNNTITNSGLGILVYTYINNQYYLEALSNTRKEPLPDNYNIRIKNNTIQTMKAIPSNTGSLWGDGIRTIGNTERPLNGVTISNNTINGTDRYGMFLEGTPKCKVTNNNVAQTGKNGIYLINSCNSSQIISNSITKSGDNGISFSKQSNDSRIIGNKIAGYKRYGIYAYQIGSATITDNEINGSAKMKSDDGIHVTGDNSSDKAFILKKNVVKTTNRNGIYINTAPECYVGGNTINGTLNYGIYIGSGSNGSKIYYNSITDPGSLGSMKNGIGLAKEISADVDKNRLNP